MNFQTKGKRRKVFIFSSILRRDEAVSKPPSLLLFSLAESSAYNNVNQVPGVRAALLPSTAAHTMRHVERTLIHPLARLTSFLASRQPARGPCGVNSLQGTLQLNCESLGITQATGIRLEPMPPFVNTSVSAFLNSIPF